MNYVSVALHSTHKKDKFSCGQERLDQYLHTQATQDIRRKLSACFVIEEPDTKKIKGYYTLANTSIDKQLIPANALKKISPPYKSLPATLLGRLAVDLHFQGKGLGALLLVDALKRSFQVAAHSIGSCAIIVDPIDSKAIEFYKKYGFILLPDSGKLFLPMETVAQLF